MVAADLPAVLDLQSRCYVAAFHEPLQAFESKQLAAPAHCWVLPAPDASHLLAYLVCLPVAQGQWPALHATQWVKPSHADWLYVHDMAVAPQARGTGAARRLLACAGEAARQSGLTAMALVAVQDSVAFWSKLGFQEATAAVDPGKLVSYGHTACFMLQPLRADESAPQN